MKGSIEHSPADHLPAPIDELRIARMWSAIDARLSTRSGPGRSRARLLSLAALAALGLGLAIYAWAGRAPSGNLRDGALIATTTTHEALTLPDGSVAALSAQTQLSVVRATESDVLLNLRQGEVSFAVSHRSGRHFAVEAGGTTITVRGTKFRVALRSASKPESVAVQVTEGVVEVFDNAARPLARLQAGQGWSSQIPVVSTSPELPVPTSPTPANSSRGPGIAENAQLDGNPKATLGGSGSKSEGSSSVVSGVTIVTSVTPTAEAMLADAKAARLAHRASDAAATLDRLRQTYPNDPRAGVAAFELGRIRLGELRDPEGALEAFRFAARRVGSGALREDAEAGVIDALTRLGRTDECLRALEAFEKRAPNSVYRRRMATACGKQ